VDVRAGPELPRRVLNADRQQYAIQSSTPISSVAAITPNAIATRSPGLLKSIAVLVRIVVSTAALAGVGGLVSCTEPTVPARRYPVLEDVGQSDWQSVSAGEDHTCALKRDGSAYCWGSNQYGQLGITHSDTTCGTGANKFPCSPTPQPVPGTAKFISISAGQRHTCAITTQREAFCWGANDQSQLGGFAGTGPTPVKVQSSLPWAEVSAGSTHSCGVRSDGALFCWGQGNRGQIGDGTFFNSALPSRVGIPAPVATVSTGDARTCARTTIGTVYCWGAVWTATQSGLELSRSQTTPQLVPGAPAMSLLSVGSFTTCGADISGFAYCWEANPRGEIGNGTRVGSTTPLRISSDLDFVQLSAGIVQSCGIVSSGAAYCWGDNSFGELGIPIAEMVERCGDGTLPCTTTPIPVLGRQSFTEISTGFGSHTCGVTTRGNLYCWGLGVSGQRGDGTISNGVTTPALVVEPRSE
jgi:alpha-tubulin suppressor-like RCC1 family protein